MINEEEYGNGEFMVKTTLIFKKDSMDLDETPEVFSMYDQISLEVLTGCSLETVSDVLMDCFKKHHKQSIQAICKLRSSVKGDV